METNYREKLAQVEKAIEANELIDVDTTILYALKHQYEEAIAREEEENKVEREEDNEMSPFCPTAPGTLKYCYEECSKEQNNSDCMGTCNGCEHRCQFIHDHKGHIMINHKGLEIWVKVKGV